LLKLAKIAQNSTGRNDTTVILFTIAKVEDVILLLAVSVAAGA